MTQERILTERRGNILVITINRPEAKNAFDFTSAEAMHAAMDLLDQQDELFVGVITGAGGVFSAVGRSSPRFSNPSRVRSPIESLGQPAHPLDQLRRFAHLEVEPDQRKINRESVQRKSSGVKHAGVLIHRL